MNIARIKRDLKKVALAQAILEAYNPESIKDMNNALKDLFESMLQGEMNNHLGYESNYKGTKKNRKQKKWLYKENT